ncbi:MAG: hypothetical protein HY657_02760 [Acidobacteria bacterium]|nr:hypothetical protein [Acidobacteriota bacterium]
MLGAVDPGLAAEFLVAVAGSVARDSAVLLIGSLVIAGTFAWLRFTREPRRLFALFLLASAPMALWALGRCAALVSGWQVNAWVMPTTGSTAREVAATIEEATSLLGPVPSARYVAVGLSAALVLVLQRRLDGVSIAISAFAALAYGALMWLAGFPG